MLFVGGLIKLNNMKELTKIINSEIGKGWKMKKLISGEVSSLFSYSPPVYDDRVVYDLEGVMKLTGEGFYLDEDYGFIALNILLKIKNP